MKPSNLAIPREQKSSIETLVWNFCLKTNCFDNCYSSGTKVSKNMKAVKEYLENFAKENQVKLNENCLFQWM